jgi:hypothetical protein
VLAGKLVLIAGPKHVLAYSYVLLLVFLALLITLPTFGWSLWILALADSLFNSLFFMAYHIDFSTVHHQKSAGKEISRLMIFAQLASAIGPFVGGLLATIYSPTVTIGAAIVITIAAIWPLMLSADNNQKSRLGNDGSLVFKSDRHSLRNNLAYSGVAINRHVGLVLWPLFMALFVFQSSPYASVGIIASVSIGVTILATRYYGRLVDRKQGRSLYRAGSVVYAIVHMARATADSFGSVLFINTMGELTAPGVILPYAKGFYAEAEESGDRVNYIVWVEVLISLARSAFYLILAFIALSVSLKSLFILSFFAAALFSLLATVENFRSL